MKQARMLMLIMIAVLGHGWVIVGIFPGESLKPFCRSNVSAWADEEQDAAKEKEKAGEEKKASDEKADSSEKEDKDDKDAEKEEAPLPLLDLTAGSVSGKELDKDRTPDVKGLLEQGVTATRDAAKGLIEPPADGSEDTVDVAVSQGGEAVSDRTSKFPLADRQLNLSFQLPVETRIEPAVEISSLDSNPGVAEPPIPVRTPPVTDQIQLTQPMDTAPGSPDAAVQADVPDSQASVRNSETAPAASAENQLPDHPHSDGTASAMPDAGNQMAGLQEQQEQATARPLGDADQKSSAPVLIGSSALNLDPRMPSELGEQRSAGQEQAQEVSGVKGRSPIGIATVLLASILFAAVVVWLISRSSGIVSDGSSLPRINEVIEVKTGIRIVLTETSSKVLALGITPGRVNKLGDASLSSADVRYDKWVAGIVDGESSKSSTWETYPLYLPAVGRRELVTALFGGRTAVIGTRGNLTRRAASVKDKLVRIFNQQ